jgi:rare lipoprotein A (peptidoglycan hydrolase)
VKVIVNDRFPHYPGRVINLSRAAAEYIQIPYNQLADVVVTAKTIPGAKPQGGAFRHNAPAPAANYGTAQPSSYGAPPANYGAPPLTNYGAPPPGYGTTAPPGGIPPPPPGYPSR